MSEVAADPKQIFLAALEQSSAAELQSYLDEACGGNVEVRSRVEALLRAHGDVGNFLGGQPTQNPTVDEPIAERPGTAIGPYKLLQQIGEGGMGTVWMAEQTQPVQRKVALKIIKAGMDSRHVLARFEAERQALALMDHPNIAKVLDAGATPEGRHYFVMELVKGRPITKYCDEHRLTPKQRLELFVPVCQAIQHAHQKGIIHRDIKPSNVLVAPYDGRPVVKVIDFGVAKATGPRLTEKTLFTEFGQVVGTLEYMSPEQAELNNQDIDTRSDIYSLGVLLYELLTGTTPLDPKRLKETAFVELLRVIREEEPPRPSTRLSEPRDTLPLVSAQRQMEPAKLTRLIRGELDWIVMKALEKDRNRRYETANGFAMDVQRYLADEPVLACPPSAAYRFRKFARRNKRALASAGIVLTFFILLGGDVGWMARDRTARQHETERTVTAALTEAETLVGQGNKQMDDHPVQWHATAKLAQSAVEKAEELLKAGVGTEVLAAQVRQVRAAVYVAVTDSRLLVELDRIRLEQAVVNLKEGRFDDFRTAPLYAQLLEDYDVDPVAPEKAAARVRDSRLRDALLSALQDWARVTQDEAERRRVLKVHQLALPPDSLLERLVAAIIRRDTTKLVELAREPKVQYLPPATLVNLSRQLAEMKEWTAAERLLRAGLERRPGDFWLNHQLGMVLLDQQPPRADEAVVYLKVARAMRPDSPGAHLNLGFALYRKGDVDEAMRRLRAALQIDPNYAMAHYNLGYALYQKSQLDDAIIEYREAIRLNKDFAEAHSDLGNALRDRGLVDEAIAECREAIQLNKDFPAAHNNLGNALQTKGLLDEAIAEYREAIHLKQDYADAHMNLGGALIAKGLLDEAIVECGEAIRLDKEFPEAHMNLGLALRAKGELRQAVEELRLGDKFGSRDSKWDHAKARSLIRKAEQLLQIEERLRTVLEGKDQPKDAAERLLFAQFCQHQRKEYGAAARFYAKAFDDEPKLAETLNSHRYNAACAAALAGCGHGRDAAGLDARERVRLRRQALDWLAADLAAWSGGLEKDPVKARSAAASVLEHWLVDPDFVGVRGTDALAKLP
jgi:serine/threonine protein kinase/tetratricopeptide (TPR) repeat protein